MDLGDACFRLFGYHVFTARKAASILNALHYSIYFPDRHVHFRPICAIAGECVRWRARRNHCVCIDESRTVHTPQIGIVA